MDNENPLNHDICPVCYWENDPVQNNNPDYSGGANDVSLSKARENYKVFGAIEDRFIQFVRKPFTDES